MLASPRNLRLGALILAFVAINQIDDPMIGATLGQELFYWSVRLTALANYDRWARLDRDAYRVAKLRCYDRMAESATHHIPDFRHTVIDTDFFTPTTVRRFTGRENGAIYGTAQKHFDGRTHLDNLYICGTDQGMVGIVGALVSGISIANRYFLDR